MTYLEAQVFIAWLGTIRDKVSEEFTDSLARIVCWMSLTLRNDRLREKFVDRMGEVVREMAD